MSGPQEYAARHARDPFEALPHGGATQPACQRMMYGYPAASVFDAPEAGWAAALASAAELLDGYRYGITSTADWIGRAVTVIGELTCDG